MATNGRGADATAPLKRNVPRFLERTQVDCCDLAVTARLGLVSDLLSLTKCRETSALNSRNVHEDVVATFIRLDEGDRISVKKVRYRTVGDMTCTAAVESSASTIEDIIREITATRTSERGETRIDDRVSEAAMEDRKKNGYF